MTENKLDKETLASAVNLKKAAIEEKANRLIEHEVLCRQNMTMQLIQETHEDWFEGCQNLEGYTCRDCGTFTASEFTVTAPDTDGHDREVCPDCQTPIDEDDIHSAEVFEWWGVTNWLSEKLAAEGEVIFDGPDFPIWGRCCTGQAIILDGIFQRIARSIIETP